METPTGCQLRFKTNVGLLSDELTTDILPVLAASAPDNKIPRLNDQIKSTVHENLRPNGVTGHPGRQNVVSVPNTVASRTVSYEATATVLNSLLSTNHYDLHESIPVDLHQVVLC